MDDTPTAALFGPADPDPDIHSFEAVQWLLEEWGRHREVTLEDIEALLDRWLRSGMLKARGKDGWIDAEAWRSHWLDWSTGGTVKVERDARGRAHVFWGSAGDYRQVTFDRAAFLRLVADELAPDTRTSDEAAPLEVAPVVEAAPSGEHIVGSLNGVVPPVEAAPSGKVSTQSHPHKYIGFRYQDKPIAIRAADLARERSVCAAAALALIPDADLPGRGRANSRRTRLHPQVMQLLKTPDNK